MAERDQRTERRLNTPDDWKPQRLSKEQLYEEIIQIRKLEKGNRQKTWKEKAARKRVNALVDTKARYRTRERERTMLRQIRKPREGRRQKVEEREFSKKRRADVPEDLKQR